MTILIESLTARPGPRYRAIADEIAEKISSGEWASGVRLPTHRDLASTLGVTVGTVSRAYAELERRGLIRGEVGRGTFVGRPGESSRERFAAEDLSTPADDPGDAFIDLGRNFPAPSVEGADLARALRAIADDAGSAHLLDYQSHAGRVEHCAAGADWIARSGYDVSPDRVIVTAAAQHGLLAALSTMVSPGERVGVESVSFPGIKTVVRMLGCELEPITMDGEGILPEAVDAACRNGVRVFCCVPSLHNPTNAIMSLARRRAIAEVIAAHDAFLIEDDIFGLLLDAPLPPISSFAPENGLYVTSLSKTLAPGLRVGYLVVPQRLFDSACAAVRTTCWMAPPVMAEVATRWINDGTAASVLVRHRKEDAARMSLALDILGPWIHARAGAPEGALHIWFHVPEGWTTASFVSAAQDRGVMLTTEAPFLVSGTKAPGALRICLGTPRNRVLLERALRRLAQILSAGPESGAEHSIV